MPRVRSDSARSIRSLSERPRRSSRQTTSVSPARKRSRASRRAGRSRASMTVSSKMRSQPSAGVSLQGERVVLNRNAGATHRQHASRSSGKRIQPYDDFRTGFSYPTGRSAGFGGVARRRRRRSSAKPPFVGPREPDRPREIHQRVRSSTREARSTRSPCASRSDPLDHAQAAHRRH